MSIRYNTHLLFSLIFLSIACTSFLGAQQRAASEVKFKLAQSYERSGDFETAAKLYEESFSKDSANNVIFDALKRMYLQLKRYDDAIRLIEYWLQAHPNDIGLLAQLGSAYVLNSDEPKAFQLWDRAIALAPKNEVTYRIVCVAVTQSRLFDRAIELYKRGRIACSNPILFTTEIANLYSATLNYAEATREYLNLIRQNPSQLGLVQSYFSQYTVHADGLKITTQVVEDAVKSEPDNTQFHHLLAWLYMEGNNFERAYVVYKLLDEKLKAGGRELFNFAERALHEKSFAIAAKAFQDIMDLSPKFDRMVQVKFGYAYTLESANETSDTLELFGGRNPFTEISIAEFKEKYSKVIEAYERVILEFPNTEMAARSFYQIALIKQKKFFDLDDARSLLEVILDKYSKFSTIQTEAQLQLADVYLIQGSIEKSEFNYKQLSEMVHVRPALREKAQFHLAEIDYFTLKFQDALTKLSTLTSNPGSDVTNDAIGLKIFLEENLQASEEALKEFARADLLKRQLKFTEALTSYKAIMKNYSQTKVIDEALINIGDIQSQLYNFTEALSTYNDLITNYPESIFIDRTLMKMGQLYQFGIKDCAKAIEIYQQILDKYPNSIFISEARKIIRQLRGDSI
ncbi:MAG: tetratricopeptide repeat protein [Ignavibacteriales bacterium]|nr:tetratricopeptide repeat protein [Ignavibacteriales bacterium]